MSSGEEDRQAFTWTLLSQTVGVWAGSGLFSAAAVSPDGCGVPVLLGIGTGGLGLLAAGGLAAAGPADRWYLLRWVNGFLNGAFVVAPVVTWIVMRLLPVMFGGAKTVDGPLNPQQSLLVPAAVMLGIIVGAVVRLTMLRDKVRHADLPTAREK